MKKFVTWDELNELGEDFLKATEQKDEDAILDMENVYEKVDTGKILILDRPNKMGGAIKPPFLFSRYAFLFIRFHGVSFWQKITIKCPTLKPSSSHSR